MLSQESELVQYMLCLANDLLLNGLEKQGKQKNKKMCKSKFPFDLFLLYKLVVCLLSVWILVKLKLLSHVL